MKKYKILVYIILSIIIGLQFFATNFKIVYIQLGFFIVLVIISVLAFIEKRKNRN